MNALEVSAIDPLHPAAEKEGVPGNLALPVLLIPELQRAQKEPGRSNLSLSLLDDPEHSQEDQDQQYEGYNADNICGTTQP